jgi:hypothetical protein
MTPAMNGAEIVGVIGATLALLDHMMGGVGAGLSAYMADAAVTSDDECRQLSPSLGAIDAIQRIAPYSLGRLPPMRTMNRRFVWHHAPASL